MNLTQKIGKIVVLGGNGHLGAAAARAFVEAGWQVSAFGRSDQKRVQGVRFVQGDANDVSALRAAVAGEDVVLNALNLPYDQWFEGRAEAQLERVLTALGTSGATLLFPGNIYNYAAKNRRITPETPEHPETPRGQIRVRMEAMLRGAAARGDVRAVVLRAGDFYGPGSSSDWFDQLILREAKKGKVALEAHDTPHTWAYLPDLSRAFVAIAEARASFAPYESFHFGGHFVSARQMFEAIAQQTSRKLTRVPTPWFVLQVMGLWNPVLREVVKMRYLFENPMELVDPRLDALLGAGFGTPFEAAISATVAPFFTPPRPAQTHSSSGQTHP